MELQIRNNKLAVRLNSVIQSECEDSLSFCDAKKRRPLVANAPRGDELGVIPESHATVIPAKARIHKDNKKRSGFPIDTFGNDKESVIPSDCGNLWWQRGTKVIYE